jgi:hypothetical protein
VVAFRHSRLPSETFALVLIALMSSSLFIGFFPPVMGGMGALSTGRYNR